MTKHEELIENVASIVFHHELEGDDVRVTAAAILATIYVAMQEPSEEMVEAAGGECINMERSDDPSYYPRDEWKAMLAASPLAQEGVISAT